MVPNLFMDMIFHGSKMESAAGMANINFNKKSLETFGLWLLSSLHSLLAKLISVGSSWLPTWRLILVVLVGRHNTIHLTSVQQLQEVCGKTWHTHRWRKENLQSITAQLLAQLSPPTTSRHSLIENNRRLQGCACCISYRKTHEDVWVVSEIH